MKRRILTIAFLALSVSSVRAETINEDLTVNAKILMNDSGRIGIGTYNPYTKLHIVSQSSGSGDNSARFSAPNIGSANSHIHYGNTGDWYIRSASTSGKIVIQDTGGNLGIGTQAPSARMHIIVPNGGPNTSAIVIDGNYTHTSGSPQLRIGIDETNKYSWIQAHGNQPLRINELGNNTLLNLGNGNVGIGTASPGHKLSVDGTVQAKEVIVETGWSDFVFEDSYRLRSLDEVEAHIEEHGHLPEVPSAAVVESEGLSVGEAQKIMMQKIEELTLYMIEKDKQIAVLQEQLEAQQLRIQELETN